MFILLWFLTCLWKIKETRVEKGTMCLVSLQRGSNTHWLQHADHVVDLWPQTTGRPLGYRWWGDGFAQRKTKLINKGIFHNAPLLWPYWGYTNVHKMFTKTYKRALKKDIKPRMSNMWPVVLNRPASMFNLAAWWIWKKK